jgi:hypothetical protein
MTRNARFFLFLAGCLMIQPSFAQQPSSNEYVLKAVHTLNENYRLGGYDLNRAYTHDIPLGRYTVSRFGRNRDAASPSPTMCVAAVQEVIIAAMHLYMQDTGDTTPLNRTGLSFWQSGSTLSLRPYLFEWNPKDIGLRSRGASHALSIFGIGKELHFSQLTPGDFVKFSRTNRTGHSVVFLGYLDQTNQLVTSYPGYENTIGFKYFSAQGMGRPDGGFGYRNGYFSGSCRRSQPSIQSDCSIINGTGNQNLLNTGRLLHPNTWTYEAAVRTHAAFLKRTKYRTVPKSLKNAALDQELPETTSPLFSGETSDTEAP